MSGIIPLVVGAVAGAAYGMLFTKQSGTDLRSHLKQSDNKVTDFFKAMIAADVAGLKDAASSVASSDIVKNVWNKAKHAAEVVKDKAADVAENVKDGVENAADKVTDATGKVVDTAKDGVNTAASTVKDGADKVKDAVTGGQQ